MSTAKTARWLDLLAFLLEHRFPVTRERISPASAATMARMSLLGAPSSETSANDLLPRINHRSDAFS